MLGKRALALFDELWFYGTALLALVLACEVAGIPLTFIPILFILAVAFLGLVLVLVLIVTMPRFIWERRRHPKN